MKQRGEQYQKNLEVEMRKEMSRTINWLEQETKDRLIYEALRLKGFSADLPGYPKVLQIRERDGFLLFETRASQIIAIRLGALPEDLRKVIEDGINRKASEGTETDKASR